jgi:hypothetical protein
MVTHQKFAERITGEIADCADFAIVQPIGVGQGFWRNELLLFVKPELLSSRDREHIRQSLGLVFDKLTEFDAHVGGAMLVGGAVLDRLDIMSQHYGFINQLSRTASEMIEANDRNKIAEALGMHSIDNCRILGGHEYLTQYPDEDCFDLDKLWFTKKSIKLRSGFYVQSYSKDEECIILVNGFHPVQLTHYTHPSHRVLLILVHSETDWGVLRNEMAGATFPEKAVSGSIRGTLYAQPRRFGLEAVSIANNGVHLSAGPFEAAFEIMNFFGRILRWDPENSPPLALQKVLQAGISYQHALDILDNPPVEGSTEPTDLFAATEDMNTDEAIAFWMEAISKEQRVAGG